MRSSTRSSSSRRRPSSGASGRPPQSRSASGAFSADEEKVARADYAYVNAGSLDELDAFVAGVMEDLGS